MKVQPIKFQLSEQSVKNIEKSTRCSINELRNLSMDDIQALMKKRGALKKPSKIKLWLADKYKELGEKLGLLKKDYNFYSDVD